MNNYTPKRIAFFSHYVGMYGANRSLLDLILGLRNYNIIPLVILPYEGEMQALLKSEGVPVLIFPFHRWVSERVIPKLNFRKSFEFACWVYGVFERLYLNLSILPKLSRKLKERNIDIIYSNSSVVAIGAMAAKWLQVPHVWHLREMADLHYGLYPDFGNLVFRRMISSADAVIAVSHTVSTHLFPYDEQRKVKVIYNGVAWKKDFIAYQQRSSTRVKNSDLYTFAIVGNINRNKGHELAVKAMSLIVTKKPSTRLLIVGDGEDTERIKSLVNTLGISNQVEFWGYLEEPYEAYFASDAILVCSRYEAMGRSTVEGMSACRPVIGLNHSGTAELVTHEVNGLLFNGKVEELAGCMLRFIDNPNWARHLGMNAWRFSRDNFSIEVYTERVFSIIRAFAE